MSRADVTGGRFPAPRPLEGLEGEPGRLPWLGLPLADRQERAFLEARLRFDPDAGESLPRILVREDVAILHSAVTAFADAIGDGETDLRWRGGGRAGELAREIGFDRDEPWLVYLAPGGAASVERIAVATPVEIDSKERLLHFPVPSHQFGVDVLELPLTDRLVMPVGHWLQLMWANLLALAPFLWRNLVGRNIAEVAWRAGWAVLRAGSVDPRRVGARLGRRGKGCRVHPTAVVEGCWLGDDVEIGPNAVVRGSVLADGVRVEDLAMVEFTVAAPGAVVQRQGLVQYSVLGARSQAGGAIKLSVLDRDCSVKFNAMLMDQALREQRVRVAVGGALVPAPLGLAGSCVGARTLVGANVYVAPGRVLPADLQVLPSPDQVLRSVPSDATGSMVVRAGRLESL